MAMHAFALGHTPFTVTASGTFALNSAPYRIAYSFMVPVTKTLSKVRAYVTAVNGTLGATNLVCEIYSDDIASNRPNASLASVNTVTATPTGAAWVEFTGFTQALTAGTRYWIVLSNANGTPATNYPTYLLHTTDSTAPLFINGFSNSSWFNHDTTLDITDPALWGRRSVNSIGPRLEFNDSTFYGYPYDNTDTSGATEQTGNNIEVGAYFVNGNANLNIIGLAFFMNQAVAGTETNVVMNLYDNITLLATTEGRVHIAGETGWYSQFFSSVQIIAPSTTVRMTIVNNIRTGTGNYRLHYKTIQNDANSKALMPFNGTFQKTRSINGGSSFTETDTQIPACALILNGANEFNFSGMVLTESPIIIPPFRSLGY